MVTCEKCNTKNNRILNNFLDVKPESTRDVLFKLENFNENTSLVKINIGNSTYNYCTHCNTVYDNENVETNLTLVI